MPTTTNTYDSLGRLRWSKTNGARVIYNLDELGNRLAEYEIPDCCAPAFFIMEKSADFTADEGAGAYYRITGTVEVTLPASPADGGLTKFKVVSGQATFIFDGSEQFFHANSAADQNLVLSPRSGVVEMCAVTAGWDET